MLQYLFENGKAVGHALWEHIYLCTTALLVGLLISFVFLILFYRYTKLMDKIVHFFNFLRLIPGVALLVIFMPVIGVGFLPTLLSLIVLTIPTLLINTHSGIKNIPPEILFCADSLGLGKWNVLFHIQLPIVFPFILLGIRTALVDLISIACVASLMGAGGLGRFILTGLAINNMDLILVGGVIITILALFCEFVLSAIQSGYSKKYLGVSK